MGGNEKKMDYLEEVRGTDWSFTDSSSFIQEKSAYSLLEVVPALVKWSYASSIIRQLRVDDNI